ncbi:MAG: hypothetical protein RI894_98 [Bacteroidota bacterium]|jgi:hypothetical protein
MPLEREEYLDIMLEQLHEYNDEFLMHGRDVSAFVNNNFLHLAEIGADPNVIRNITTAQLPLAPTFRTDTLLSFQLDNWTTEPFVAPAFEEKILAYPKAQSFFKQHTGKLMRTVADYCYYSIAPNANTTDTPVLETSGAVNAAGNKGLTDTDVKSLAEKFDDLNISAEGRHLWLTPNMYYELIGTNEAMQFAAMMKSSGASNTPEYVDVWGFKIHRRTGGALYDAALTKQAHGSANANLYRGAFAYVENETFFAAKGTVEVGVEPRPVSYEGDLVNAKVRYSAQALRQKIMGAIVQK